MTEREWREAQRRAVEAQREATYLALECEAAIKGLAAAAFTGNRESVEAWKRLRDDKRVQANLAQTMAWWAWGEEVSLAPKED